MITPRLRNRLDRRSFVRRGLSEKEISYATICAQANARYVGIQLGYGKAGSSSGKYVIAGLVLDTSGQPVSGAAVSVGAQIVYSDSAGSWQSALKACAANACTASPEEFSAPGDWSALTAPQSVIPQPETSGTTVLLTVERR